MFNNRIFFEIEEFSFFKKEIFSIIVLKYILLETNNIYLTFFSVCTHKLHTVNYLN